MLVLKPKQFNAFCTQCPGPGSAASGFYVKDGGEGVGLGGPLATEASAGPGGAAREVSGSWWAGVVLSLSSAIKQSALWPQTPL